MGGTGSKMWEGLEVSCVGGAGSKIREGLEASCVRETGRYCVRRTREGMEVRRGLCGRGYVLQGPRLEVILISMVTTTVVFIVQY